MRRLEPIPADQLPERARAQIEAGMASGMYSDGTGVAPAQIRVMAYNGAVLDATYAQSQALWHTGVLGDRIAELIRIRSAQVNGCIACASRIKGDEVSVEETECMLAGTDDNLDAREAAAVDLVGRIATDHHGIDDDDLRALSELFSPAELVELVYRVCVMLGQHRFHHVFRSYEVGEPMIPFDPAAIDAASVAAHQA